ncbi:MAG TPA: hypothetical protein VEA18_03990 [Candidatus Kapabacteria bacterium]|nr:hypothetical protein [Candidatus Kapabacteria bacterium]
MDFFKKALYGETVQAFFTPEPITHPEFPEEEIDKVLDRSEERYRIELRIVSIIFNSQEPTAEVMVQVMAEKIPGILVGKHTLQFDETLICDHLPPQMFVDEEVDEDEPRLARGE